jgi:UDP-N-acetylmuramoyl-tripeptide--D-alanyl-D-alanine ligase
VIPLSLDEIARVTGARLDGGADPAAVVRGPVVIDSRRVSPGGLFAAVEGERVDGHDYAATARAAGAVAMLGTRPAGVPALIVDDVPGALAKLAQAVVPRLPQATIAGLTGSAGKTSTKDLTAQLVERLGPTISPEGSYNNEFGFPLTVLRADEQTRFMVLELAARGPGHIAFLCEIAPPRVGAVLNVGHAHTGEFGGIEQVARAKGELPAALPAAAAGGVAILNADDHRVRAMAARTEARIVTFGLAGGAGASSVAGGRPDFSAEDVWLDDLGRPAFTLVTPAGRAAVQMGLHGAHQVPNALAAAAIAAELGLGIDGIADGLSSATTRSRWRMEVQQAPGGVTVINDAYNANPESVAAALRTLVVLAGARRRSWAVLGPLAELGEAAAQAYRELGTLTARLGIDRLVVVGEQAQQLHRAVPGSELVPDVPAAVELLHGELAAGDVVLIKASRSFGLERVAEALLGGSSR